MTHKDDDDDDMFFLALISCLILEVLATRTVGFFNDVISRNIIDSDIRTGPCKMEKGFFNRTTLPSSLMQNSG